MDWREELKPNVNIYKIANQLELPRDIAQVFLDNYWKKLEPRIKSLLEQVIEDTGHFSDMPAEDLDYLKQQLKAKWLN